MQEIGLEISWSNRAENEEVLHRVMDENTLHIIKRRKVNWIGHILRRNCFLKQVIEGNKEGKRYEKRRRGKRCKQLQDRLTGTTGYWNLQQETLDHTLWGTGFGRGCGQIVRQTTE